MCHQPGVDERVHTCGLTCGQSIMTCFYMMRLGANFIMREVASSANSCADCHYDIYHRTHSVLKTQFLQVIVFHGFILFSVSLILLYHHRICYFPMMGVERDGEEVGLHVSKKMGNEKRKGSWYTFPHYAFVL